MGYYGSMLNNRSFRKSPVHVDSIIEVRLCGDTWEKVQKVSYIKNSSYSWVVRYAVFRLIRRRRPEVFMKGRSELSDGFDFFPASEKFRLLNDRALRRRKGSSAKHRHKLCLYGEDELLIRLVAIKVMCSMTHLVRLALEWYLDSLLNSALKRRYGRERFFHEAFWYWLGIKVQQAVEFPSLSLTSVKFNFKRYEKYDYF